MCGIAGFLTTLTDTASASRGVLGAMLARMAHRGPDGSGTVERVLPIGVAALGAARLSLLDFAHGHQPMRGRGGDLAVALNGEIINHEQLRGRLPRRQFKSRCDTETVLALWEELGPRCVELLDGMFAIAVLDGDQLWLARDPFGIKPLYLLRDRNGVAWASETKAFFALPWFEPQLDPRAVIETAIFGHPLRNRTFWREITELPPGTLLNVTGNSGRVECHVEPVHRLSAVAEGKHGDDIADDPALQSRVILESSVRQYLQADHPVGLFLSGGLDSTLLLALADAARRECGATEPLHTFTFGDHRDLPDVTAARLVAKSFGTRHHECAIELDDVVAALVSTIRAAETPSPPFGPSVVFPHVRQYVKAALCGEGADELFGGYWMHREPDRFAAHLASRYMQCFRSHSGDNARDVFRTAGETVAALVRADSHTAAGATRSSDPALDDVSAGRRHATRGFLLEEPLRWLHLHPWDQLSMAASLEVRLPYLTRDLLRVADRWAGRDPVGPGGSKAPLRRLAREMLPQSIAARVIDRAKEPAPANSAGVTQRVARYAAEVVPPGHAEGHPLARLPSFSRSGTALGILLFDLFVATFLVHRADPPSDFSPERLYGSPSEFRALEGVLDSLRGHIAFDRASAEASNGA